MQNLSESREKFNHEIDADGTRFSDERPLPIAVDAVSRKFRLPVRRARLIAGLAGLGGVT